MTNQLSQDQDTVTFTLIWDSSLPPSKDGLELNGYVVNIDNIKSDFFDEKRVRISGKVTIVKGLDFRYDHIDDNRDLIQIQGRMDDTKHINNPVIQIVK